LEALLEISGIQEGLLGLLWLLHGVQDSPEGRARVERHFNVVLLESRFNLVVGFRVALVQEPTQQVVVNLEYVVLAIHIYNIPFLSDLRGFGVLGFWGDRKSVV